MRSFMHARSLSHCCWVILLLLRFALVGISHSTGMAALRAEHWWGFLTHAGYWTQHTAYSKINQCWVDSIPGWVKQIWSGLNTFQSCVIIMHIGQLDNCYNTFKHLTYSEMSLYVE